MRIVSPESIGAQTIEINQRGAVEDPVRYYPADATGDGHSLSAASPGKEQPFHAGEGAEQKLSVRCIGRQARGTSAYPVKRAVDEAHRFGFAGAPGEAPLCNM